MRKPVLVAITVVITFICSVLIFEFTLQYQRASGYINETLFSEVLDEEREIVIRLPQGYDETSYKYPVVYKLDGESRLWRYDDTINILSSVEYIPEMIVVAIPNTNRDRDLTPSGMSLDGKVLSVKGGGSRFLDFIEKELIPYIEARYRTSDMRILAGYSRGGLLVVESLLSRPNLFQARFALSPALWRDDQAIISKAREVFSGADYSGQFLYMSLGDQENDKMRSAFQAFQQLLEISQPVGLQWQADFARSGNHQTTPIIALPFAFQALSKTELIHPVLSEK